MFNSITYVKPLSIDKMLDNVDIFEQEWKCEWKVSIRLIYIYM